MPLFPSRYIFCIIAVFSMYGEHVVRSFLSDGVFDISLCENSINQSNMYGSLCPDRGSAGGAEGQIHGSPQLHHCISARSEILFLRLNRRELQDRGERSGRRRRRYQGVGRIWPRHAQRKRQITAAFRRRQQAHSSEHFILHPQKWGVLYAPKRQPQKETSTFGLYPDKAGQPPTDPLRQCPPAPLRGTTIGSQSRVCESPHPLQVRTKSEKEGQYHGDSEAGRPYAVDD